jgi:hypothetical protein
MKTPWHALHLVLLVSAVALAGGCGDGGGGDDGDTGGADDGDGDGDGGSAPGDDGDGDGDGGDGGGAACSDACATLAGDPDCAAMGVDAATCASLCTSDACATCLEASAMCGLDCQTACAGGGDDGADDGADDGVDSSGGGDDGADDGADDGGVPEIECINDGECGISFECVSCGLNDGAGWCFQTMECSFDEDCGSGGKCGYNVQSSDYRCLPAANCG